MKLHVRIKSHLTIYGDIIHINLLHLCHDILNMVFCKSYMYIYFQTGVVVCSIVCALNHINALYFYTQENMGNNASLFQYF